MRRLVTERLAVDELGRVEAEERRRADYPAHARTALDEVNDATVRLPSVGREAHAATNLHGG
jgi:hypothetical protein